MKKLIAVVGAVIAGCAHGVKPSSYLEATSHRYIGNGMYEISADGNTATSPARISTYVFRRAFEVCRDKHHSGYQLVNSRDTTERETDQTTTYNALARALETKSSTTSWAGREIGIKCTGPIDPIMANQNSEIVARENAERAEQERKLAQAAEAKAKKEADKLDLTKYGQ